LNNTNTTFNTGATFAKTDPDGREYSADEIHAVNLASLHDEFCQVVTMEDVIAYRKDVNDGRMA